jgi:FixJ family two-component response regulator
MTQELRKQFIVVVDGDPDVCRTIQRCAWSHGIHADGFTSAREFIGAIESMPAFVPDCVVLDMQLSQLEGFDVLERLGRSRPNTPVICLTGTIDPALPQVVPRSDSRGFFAKPVDPDLFISTLLDLLDIQSAVHLLQQLASRFTGPRNHRVQATSQGREHLLSGM